MNINFPIEYFGKIMKSLFKEFIASQPTSRAKAIKALNEIVKIDSSVLVEV